MATGPGGGGKSLELMQRRLLSGQAPAPDSGEAPNPPADQQPPANPQPTEPTEPAMQQANPASRPGKSAASLMATQAREQANGTQDVEQQPASGSPSAGRPKGKDFAAMAMNVGASSNTRGPIAPTPAPVDPPVLNPVSASPTNGRPKGKDFSAMANRMGAPASQPAPIPVVQHNSHLPATQNIKLTPSEDEAQKLRARKMQAAARAAAGLPPLETLTATSVTTIPPPISPPKAARSSPNAASQSSQMQDVRHQQQLLNQQQMQQQQQQQQKYQQQQALLRQQAATTARAQRQSDGTPTSSRGTSRTSANDPHYAQNRATPQPTEKEGRLSTKTSKYSSKSSSVKASTTEKSSAASKAGTTTGAPYMAPLLGDRIQDILNGIDPNYVMETEAEEQVLQLADDFLDKVIRQSFRLAQHRGSKALDVQDVQLVLAKHWGIIVPGLGLPTIRPLKPGKQAASKTSHGGGSHGSKRKSTTDGTGSGGGSRKKSTVATSVVASQAMPAATQK